MTGAGCRGSPTVEAAGREAGRNCQEEGEEEGGKGGHRGRSKAWGRRLGRRLGLEDERAATAATRRRGASRKRVSRGAVNANLPSCVANIMIQGDHQGGWVRQILYAWHGLCVCRNAI